MINILIIARAGPGVLAIGSAATIPIAYVLDFVVHGEKPVMRELSGCSLILISLSLALSRPGLDSAGPAKVLNGLSSWRWAGVASPGRKDEQGKRLSGPACDPESLQDEVDGSRRRR